MVKRVMSICSVEYSTKGLHYKRNLYVKFTKKVYTLVQLTKKSDVTAAEIVVSNSCLCKQSLGQYCLKCSLRLGLFSYLMRIAPID